MFGPEQDDDRVRLAANTSHSLVSDRELLGSEGDVRRLFFKALSGPVRQAWSYFPHLRKRAEARAPGLPSSATVAGIWFSYLCGGQDRCVAVGELKRPGTIISTDWEDRVPSDRTKNLGKELRGYAHKYNCPQVFCYDGESLLILRFRASSREAIQDASCPIGACLTKNSSGGPGTATARYALYRLIVDGFRRVQGDQLSRPVQLAGYRREFEYFSGRSLWMDPSGQTVFDHPLPGYERVFIEGERA
ncbi:MAG: hypothetical protein M1816_001222 [Peltula sp. TS41687]|nr:MAG: hypothetical protein M1816_001222 [Peltula sp. TS41687]